MTSSSPDTPPLDYRTCHLGAAKARDYDRDFWSPHSAKGLGWELEQDLLDIVFERHLLPAPRRAVDFACGTGRVLAYLERRVRQSFGIDVSPDMLALARDRCRSSTLIRHDVTHSAPTEVPAPIDVITAFRFFLNAGPQLRGDVLSWMRATLAPTGHLVANFHLNPASARGGYLRLRWAGKQRTPMLRPEEADDLLRDAGFSVVARYGYEFLPYRGEGARLLAAPMRRRIEHGLLDRPRLAGLGNTFLIVARPVRER